MREYLQNIVEAVVTIAKGMWVTLRHLFMPSVTQQYVADERPGERWRSPIVPEGLLDDRSRMRLHVKIEDCIGCKQCEKVCPVDCIYITTEKREKTAPGIFASNGMPIKQGVKQFDIDMSLCCYCGLCTYPCPTDCIVMIPEYESATSEKGRFLFRFAKEEPPPPKSRQEEPEPAQTGER
jgi:NADH-quinone oxidoreductase subunit I